MGGICRGASHGIGMRSLMQDLGFKWDLELWSDASAAIGICKRRGLGKVRHLAVADLWGARPCPHWRFQTGQGSGRRQSSRHLHNKCGLSMPGQAPGQDESAGRDRKSGECAGLGINSGGKAVWIWCKFDAHHSGVPSKEECPNHYAFWYYEVVCTHGLLTWFHGLPTTHAVL